MRKWYIREGSVLDWLVKLTWILVILTVVWVIVCCMLTIGGK